MSDSHPCAAKTAANGASGAAPTAAAGARPDAAPRGGRLLIASDTFANVVPGVHVLPGQGNTIAIETARGVVVVDAGPGGRVTAALIAKLRELTDKPVSHLVYSHGHGGYNYGVRDWIAAAAARGEPRPQVVAQRGVRARYRRYLETAGLQQWLNSRQFRGVVPLPAAELYVMPDLAFDERLVIDGGDRDVELIAAPSETDDALAVWLASERFLYGGAAVMRSIPNVGTPLRTMRDAVRWARTLETLHALRPAVIATEFGAPITDPKDVEDVLRVPIAGLRWLRDAVVARMNAGMSLDDIVHDVELPDAIFGHKFMRPIYGAPEYVIRDIWRSENGWWDRNPTTLHPVAPALAAADLHEAMFGGDADAQAVIARAKALADAGDTQLALHVLDLVALGPDDGAGVAQARALKADLLDARAVQVPTVVSRNLYRSAAEELRGQPIGSTRAQDPIGNFSWD